MIALVLAGDLPVEPFRRRLRRGRRTVDGPFRALSGLDGGGEEWLVLHAEDAIAPCHGAGRLAGHREARLILHLARAQWTVAPQEDFAEGLNVLPAAALYDASLLDDLQRLTPDAATELPLPLPDLPRVWSEEDAPAQNGEIVAASFPIPLTVPCLAQHLHERRGVLLADLSAAGTALAAREIETAFQPLFLATGNVQPRWKSRGRGGLLAHKEVIEAIDRFLDEQGWFNI